MLGHIPFLRKGTAISSATLHAGFNPAFESFLIPLTVVLLEVPKVSLVCKWMFSLFSKTAMVLLFFFLNFLFVDFLKHFLNCCFSTVVSSYLPTPPSPPIPTHLPPSILPPLALSMCPLYMFLEDSSPIIPCPPPL